MLQLHITNKNYSSWSLRPWLLMQALGIPFQEVLHPFPASGARDLFRQFSPNGKVPCLLDGDIRVWDSLAITEYLAEQYPSVWPSDGKARAWARCAVAEMHSGFQTLRTVCGMNCGVRVKMTAVTPALSQDVARINELWRHGLDTFGGPFLAGSQFTAVDAFFAPVVFRVQTYQLAMDAQAQAYAEHLLSLPALQRWYNEALQEAWREPAHEQDVLDAGEILADLRNP